MMRRALHLTFLLFFLLSCGSPAATVAPPTPLVTTTPSPAQPPTPLPTDTPLPTATPMPPLRFDRVLIVSFDGLRPDAIVASEMENVLALMRGGAYTFGAQTIMPSVTLPAHSSMLVGTCPAKHIVRWNQYVPDNGYAIGADLFDLAHAAGMRTVMVVGKEKLRQITEPASTDFFAFVDDTDNIPDPFTIEQLAIQQMMKGFNLMFVHFPNGDLEGRDHGWMSNRQLKQYGRDDESFGYILAALKNLGLYESTLIIVTADHGGHDTTHGSDRLEDMTIPWIISGLGIQSRQLTTPVHTTDTAATAAFALGLQLPAEWDGVPVFEAFDLSAPVRDFPVCE
jgi:hypothetical protein